MTTLILAKHHGCGNDFLILLDTDGSHPISAELARALCDRRRGVGADGVIRATVPATGPARLGFELRNADGSGAEMSGNGVRCLAHAAFDAGLVPAGEPFGVLTPTGIRQVTLRPAEGPGTVWASVAMGTGRVVGEPGGVPAGERRVHVDMGNPHLVILGPDPATVAVAQLGPALEREHPRGINVEWVAVGPGPGHATMRVWERGAGETEACGTGSGAVAVALRHWGRAGAELTVHQPGGALGVALADDGGVTVAGPSQRVATVEVRTEDLRA
jgi:diaminopimelate epimerase